MHERQFLKLPSPLDFLRNHLAESHRGSLLSRCGRSVLKNRSSSICMLCSVKLRVQLARSVEIVEILNK